jgi:hypothetical protein
VPIIACVTLGDNVRVPGRGNFMTREQLAKAAVISHRTLVNIETKRVTESRFSTILEHAEARGVEPYRLVDRE